jgi:hypothetical protein
VNQDRSLSFFARCKKEDFEKVLPEWSKTVGRPFTVTEGRFIDIVAMRVSRFRNQGDEEFFRFHAARDRCRLSLMRWEVTERRGNEVSSSARTAKEWNLSKEQVEQLDYNYVEAVVVMDPFMREMEDIDAVLGAHSLLEDICERVGCGYVIPAAGPKVRIKIKDRTRTAYQHIKMVADCAGWQYELLPSLREVRISAEDALEEGTKRGIALDSDPIKFFEQWVTRKWLDRTEDCVLHVKPR